MSILYRGVDVFSVVILFGWEGVVWGIIYGFCPPIFIVVFCWGFSIFVDISTGVKVDISTGAKVDISITAYSL